MPGIPATFMPDINQTNNERQRKIMTLGFNLASGHYLPNLSSTNYTQLLIT